MNSQLKEGINAATRAVETPHLHLLLRVGNNVLLHPKLVSSYARKTPMM
jgi:hypothetical protein